MSHRHSPLWPDHRIKPPYGSVEIDGGHPLAVGLVDEWLCNEGAGSIRNLTRSNAGILDAGVTWGSSLKGTALAFNGSSRVALANPPIAAYPISVSYWVRETTQYPASIHFAITTAAGFVACGSNGATSFITDYNNVGASRANFDAYYLVAQWNHVVLVHRSASDVSLYFNGHDVTSASGDYWGSRAGSYLGSRGDPSPGFYLAGQLHHVGIWNRAFTSVYVLQLLSDPYCFLREIHPRTYGFLGAAASGFKPYWVRRQGAQLLTPGVI
jgi:hypothetical protein